MYVALWERNLDIVLVEDIVDVSHNLADGNSLLYYVNPAEHLEVYAVVAKFVEDNLRLFLLVHRWQLEGVGAVFHKFYDTFHVGAVSNSERYCGKHVSVILCEVLVVLGEELRVGEGRWPQGEWKCN